MFKLLVKSSLVLIVLMQPCLCAISQNLVADSTLLQYQKAVNFYNQSLNEELHLFNGQEDKEYTYNFNEGTPYFISNNWSIGTVNYDGKTYDSVSLLYDVALDKLIYLYFDKISRVRLIKEKVSAFTLMGHSFINLTDNTTHAASLASGFYDQLYHGSVSLLVKRTKNIQTSYKQSGADRRVFDKNHYYLQKGDNFFVVKSKKSFLANLSDKSKELQQFMRQNSLNFRRDKETAMTKTLAYYNEIINKQ